MGLRVRTIFSGATGSPWLSTIFFAGPGDQSSADAAVAAVGAFWGTIDNLMASGISWTTEAEVAFVDPVTGNVTAIFGTTPQTGSGAGAAQQLPPLNQALVNVRTGFFVSGREIRGRIFVPGLTEAANGASGVVEPTTIGTILTAAQALLSGANHQLVVYSRTAGQDRVASSVSVPNEWKYLSSRRD